MPALALSQKPSQAKPKKAGPNFWLDGAFGLGFGKAEAVGLSHGFGHGNFHSLLNL